MDINGTLAIICYVFVTLLVVYWLYGILNKHTDIDDIEDIEDIEEKEEKEDNIKKPLI